MKPSTGKKTSNPYCSIEELSQMIYMYIYIWGVGRRSMIPFENYNSSVLTSLVNSGPKRFFLFEGSVFFTVSVVAGCSS